MSNKKDYFDKTNFTKYLLGILIFAFIFSSINSMLFMSNKYNIIIGKYKKVNINEFVSILNNEKRSMASLKLTEEQLAQLNSREFMLSTLSRVLYSKLIDMEIENFVIQKPKKLILDDILQEKDFYTDGKFDIIKLERFLKRYNVSEQDYIKIIQESHNKKFLIDTLTELINTNNYSLKILQSEANKYKNIEVFSIEKGRLENYSGDVTENEIKHYYNSNINNFIIPEERRLDYIKITNCTEEQISEFQSLRSKGLSIQEIAKEMNLKVDTYGYLKKEDIENNGKYKDIPDIFEYSVGKIFAPKKKDGDTYFYCIADSKESRVKSLDEVKKEIKMTIQDKKTEELRLKIVIEIAEEYKKNGFNSEFLTSKNFKSQNKKGITKNSKDYDKDFLASVMKAKKGEVTKVFADDKVLYFAFIRAEGVLTKENKQYIDITEVKKGLSEENNDRLFRYYTNYLRDKKYKLKVNYKLLDLIK